MSSTPVHLVLGDEELLVDRAVSAIVSEVAANGAHVPVSRLRAGDADVAELAEMVSPSLFAEDRVVIFESAAEAGKDAAALILDVASDPPAGVTLVVVHSGGGRAKSMVDGLRGCGATEHSCLVPTKTSERAAWIRSFVRKEFDDAGVRVSGNVELKATIGQWTRRSCR